MEGGSLFKNECAALETEFVQFLAPSPFILLLSTGRFLSSSEETSKPRSECFLQELCLYFQVATIAAEFLASGDMQETSASLQVILILLSMHNKQPSSTCPFKSNLCRLSGSFCKDWAASSKHKASRLECMTCTGKIFYPPDICPSPVGAGQPWHSLLLCEKADNSVVGCVRQTARDGLHPPISHLCEGEGMRGMQAYVCIEACCVEADLLRWVHAAQSRKFYKYGKPQQVSAPIWKGMHCR